MKRTRKSNKKVFGREAKTKRAVSGSNLHARTVLTSADLRRGHVQRCVSELIKLYEMTHGEAAASVRNKDAHADKALKLASMLFDTLAGWARDHTIGRIVQDFPAVGYASGTKRERELPEHRPWDDPQLERIGASYDYKNAEANKRIIRDLARPLSHVLGSGLSSQLENAFTALLFGGHHALVRPTPAHLKGDARTLWELRFRAIEHVEFRRGRGMRKGAAQDLVAEAYRLEASGDAFGRDTLRQWERRIPTHFSPFVIEDSKSGARSHGGNYDALRQGHQLDVVDQHYLAELEEKFGDKALKIDGRRFQTLNETARRRR